MDEEHSPSLLFTAVRRSVSVWLRKWLPAGSPLGWPRHLPRKTKCLFRGGVAKRPSERPHPSAKTQLLHVNYCEFVNPWYLYIYIYCTHFFALKRTFCNMKGCFPQNWRDMFFFGGFIRAEWYPVAKPNEFATGLSTCCIWLRSEPATIICDYSIL